MSSHKIIHMLASLLSPCSASLRDLALSYSKEDEYSWSEYCDDTDFQTPRYDEEHDSVVYDPREPDLGDVALYLYYGGFDRAHPAQYQELSDLLRSILSPTELDELTLRNQLC